MNPAAARTHEHRLWPDQVRPDGSPPRSGGRLRSLLHWINPTRSFTVDGVVYRPLSRVPLERAIAAGGAADYAVTFPAGERLRIRATRERVFADLLPDRNDPLAWLLAECAAVIRPGWRAAALGVGTGLFTTGLADMVGPSGSVVGLEQDVISVAYARKRYRLPNVAHERGGHTALSAEPDRSCEALILSPRYPRTDLAPLWRLVARGGALVAAAHHAAAAEQIAGAAIERVDAPAPDHRLVFARRAEGA
jgi:hypothetical protein